MKRLGLILLVVKIILSQNLFAQNLLKFDLNHKADVRLGTYWNPENYDEISNPINVEFDGKTLIMTYTSGKKYASFEIVEYEKKDFLKSGKVIGDIYILKFKENNYVLPIKMIYEKDWDVFTLEIPFLVNDKIGSYTYFTKF